MPLPVGASRPAPGPGPSSFLISSRSKLSSKTRRYDGFANPSHHKASTPPASKQRLETYGLIYGEGFSISDKNDCDQKEEEDGTGSVRHRLCAY